MSASGQELDSAGMDFARTAARALQAAQAVVEMHARAGERRERRAEHAAREQERTARADDLAHRRAEREQRMAEREQRMSQRDQRMTARQQRGADRSSRRDPVHHDRAGAREAMAARWAAADAVRRLHPDAAAAWDAAMRDGGIDPDQVRRLAEATHTARTTTATPDRGASHPDTGTAETDPADLTPHTGAGRAEQLAMDFVTHILDEQPTPATDPDTGPDALRGAPAAELGGGGIGDAITAAASPGADVTAGLGRVGSALGETGPGVDTGTGTGTGAGAVHEPETDAGVGW